jgi:hypothetical protein
MSKRKWAAILAALLAVLIGIGVGVSSTSAVSAGSRGPNVVQEVETVDLTDKIQNVATACKSLKYPDGAYMVEFCYEYAASGTPGHWFSGWRGMTNIAYPAGHTDTMRYCIYGVEHCTGYVADGADWGDGFSYTIHNTDTMWVEFHVLYGSTWYCRRGFGNNVGGIAFTTC